MNDKTKNIIGWVLAGLLSILFIGSGFMKLTSGDPNMAKMLGGQSNMMALGVLEVLMVVLFLVPRTSVVGALLMIAYIGGAMAVHLTSGQSIVIQTVIQCLIWITSVLRFPELGQKLFNNAR